LKSGKKVRKGDSRPVILNANDIGKITKKGDTLMKTKKIIKKLELSKETLVNLDDCNMNEIKGGWEDPPFYTLTCEAKICFA
jgi:hypothetical protein